MGRITGAAIALLIAAGASAATGQSSPPPAAPPQAQGEIRGSVRDAASGQPLAGASVAVRRASDSTLVAGGVSRADGAFRIQGLGPGRYYLRVSRLGYTTGTVSGVAVGPGRQTADAGTVRLAAGAVALQGITATTERATVTSTPGVTVVSTANMPTVTGGTATDVLRNVPGVDVDADGNVTLRGNPSVAIQINGRRSPLTGDALTSFIKQLPANLIDRVEVVPNPSAKYDPDGMGGILNLVLKQNTELGTGGGVSVGAGTGGRYSASGNLGRQRGPLTLFGSYGFNRDARESNAFGFRDEHFGGVPETFRQQLTLGRSAGTSHTATGSADLKLGSRNVLSSTFLLNHRAGDNTASSGFTVLDSARRPLDAYRQDNGTREAGLTTEYTLAFARTLQPRKHELTGELRFNRSRQDNAATFSTVPGAATPAELLGDSRTALGAVTRELDWQADYTRPVFGGARLEAGYKGTLRRLDNHSVVDSLFGGVPDPALRLVNDFTYDESVQAGYALLTQPIGETFSLQGGVRAELATTRFRLASSPSASANDYTTLFPSAAATWQPSERDELSLSYSKRIERPEPRQLNPFPLVQDQFHVTVGNPQLKPEFEHSFEASYQRSVPFGSLTLTPFYRHIVDEVKRIHRTGTGGVDTLTFLNLASSTEYGSEFRAQLRGAGRVSGFVSGSAYRQVTDGSNLQAGLGAAGFSWSARANLNLKASRNTDLQWSQSYRSARVTEQGRNGSQSMTNVAVRQKLSEHGSLNLRVSDPFNVMRQSSSFAGADYSETQSRRFDSRALYVAFSWTFGNAPRVRRVPEPEQPPQDTGGSGS